MHHSSPVDMIHMLSGPKLHTDWPVATHALKINPPISGMHVISAATGMTKDTYAIIIQSGVFLSRTAFTTLCKNWDISVSPYL